MINLRTISLAVALFILSGCAAQINEVTNEKAKKETVLTQHVFLDVSSSDVAAKKQKFIKQYG